MLCGVESERHLLHAADRLFLNDIHFALFREPDRGGEPTALATEPLPPSRRGLLARYRCLIATDFLAPDRAKGPGGPSGSGAEGGVS